jgi:ParB family chromosome partitioning protein
MLEMALIENIQRENLNAIEVALSFQRMIEECNLKQEELGRPGEQKPVDSYQLPALLKLPPSHTGIAARWGSLAWAMPRRLLTYNDPTKQLFLHQHIIQQGLSVRKVEEMVRDMQKRR